MSHAVGYALGAAIALVLVVVLTPVTVGWRNRQLSRVRARHPQAEFVGPVTKAPSGPNAAVLIVDTTSLRLVRFRGAVQQEWTWPTVRSVRVDTVRFGVSHRRGLVLDIDSRWEPRIQFIVFGRSWLKVSTTRTDDAAAEMIAHHLRGADPESPTAPEHPGDVADPDPR